MCHQAEYGPRFFVFRAEKASGGGAPCGSQKTEQLCRGGQSTTSSWSSVKKWLLHINYAPGYAPEPEEKPVCRQFSRCEGCPYPAHGFLCWGGEDDCMRTRVKKLNEKELEHED